MNFRGKNGPFGDAPPISHQTWVCCEIKSLDACVGFLFRCYSTPYTDLFSTAESVTSAQNSAVVASALFLTSTAAHDELRGGLGNNTLIGGAGDDVLFDSDSASDLRDVMYGGAGNDYMDGGYGNDELRGDIGNDTIAGGFGHDRMNGGAGADSFYHLGIFDHGSDWVQDYRAAEGDVLQFGQAVAPRGIAFEI